MTPETDASRLDVVTILFTDIEGFTRVIERLGDHAAHEILRAHNAIVRREVAAHGGLEVKVLGDGFMLALATAHQALDCAIALQRAVARWSDESLETPLRVRMGLHTGRPIQEAGDFTGRCVIIAARIAAAAGGGEILASAEVRELTREDFVFDEGRELELKGLAGRHRLFAVDWQHPVPVGWLRPYPFPFVMPKEHAASPPAPQPSPVAGRS